MTKTKKNLFSACNIFIFLFISDSHNQFLQVILLNHCNVWLLDNTVEKHLKKKMFGSFISAKINKTTQIMVLLSSTTDVRWWLGDEADPTEWVAFLFVFNSEILDLEIGDIVHRYFKVHINGSNFLSRTVSVGIRLQGDSCNKHLFSFSLEFVDTPFDYFVVSFVLNINFLVDSVFGKFVWNIRCQLRYREAQCSVRSNNFLRETSLNSQVEF